jgi:hypothetical protein
MMRIATTLTLFVLATFVAFSEAIPTEAGIPFRDDFQDGSFTDNMPVSWVAPDYAQIGSRSIEDGNFVIERTGRDLPLDTEVAGHTYGKVSLRTLARTNSETGIGLFAASTLSGPVDNADSGSQIWALLLGDGELLGGTVLGNIPEVNAQQQLPWDPTGQDVHLRLDYFSGSVKFWAWPASAEAPISPQLQFDVTRSPRLDTEGRIGIWIWNPLRGELGPVEFREVTAVPEPSALVLVAMGLVGPFGCRRRQY